MERIAQRWLQRQSSPAPLRAHASFFENALALIFVFSSSPSPRHVPPAPSLTAEQKSSATALQVRRQRWGLVRRHTPLFPFVLSVHASTVLFLLRCLLLLTSARVMVARNVAVTVHLTYGALMAALIVCSLLSPIQVRSVGDRQLRVYGVLITYNAPPASWLLAVSGGVLGSGSSGNGSGEGDDVNASSSSPDDMTPVRVLIRNLPSSALKRYMAAYLAFAGISVVSALAFLVMLVVHLLPAEINSAAVVVTRAFAVLLPLAAIACFITAALLGLQSDIYRDVASGYYTDSSKDVLTAKLHSGFSATVVSACVGLVVVLLSPVFWKE